MQNATDLKPGNLVTLRQREWIVQPSNDPDVLRVKPLGGSDAETTGIYLPFNFGNEKIERYYFPHPAVDDQGDLASARLLYDAIRLGFRDAAGPFRSIAKFNFAPRAYQMVPLIMALKQDDPVRLFIADDVGIGKTIESLMVARELMDRGRIDRFAVVCLPHLCEQWQREMREKFGIEAVIIRSSTAAALDRKKIGDDSVFRHYPFQVISIDYVKSVRRADSFVADCPELVIVDEVHSASASAGAGRQQRHHLLRRLSAKDDQHLILLSATPHSGKPEEFQSLLGLLKPEFAEIELGRGNSTQQQRRHLAAHYVQRRRADIIEWDGAKYHETTHFPDRSNSEVSYPMSPEYLELQYDVMRLAKTIAGREESKQQRKRLNYWTALGLLRGVMSSPAAGIAMLENRAARAIDDEELELIDTDGNPILENDFGWNDDEEPLLFLNYQPSPDGAPSAAPSPLTAAPAASPKNFQHELSRKLAEIHEKGLDLKVRQLVKLVKQWQKEGFQPIVYCRYIHTAEYVGQALRAALPNRVGVATVTSKVADERRQEIVDSMGDYATRVLVATDCMSEGINLQRYFTAVIHYDLPWNPNRLEQREGRVDRFGQRAPEVRTALLWGEDNPMDGIVLKVLLRKAREIKQATGVSVPFPENNQSIMEAVTQAVLQQDPPAGQARQLGLFENLPEVNQSAEAVQVAYGELSDRIEEASKSIFAQRAVKAQDIDQDLEQAIRLIGNMESVRDFTLGGVTHLNGNWTALEAGYRIEKAGLPYSLQQYFDEKAEAMNVSFETPTPEGFRYLARNHPFVDTLGQLLMAQAMDGRGKEPNPVRRTAVVRTRAVAEMTTVLLLRVRNVIESLATRRQIVAEELVLRGYRGLPPAETWIDEAAAMALLQSEATGEVAATEKREAIADALEDLEVLKPPLDGFGRDQAEALVEAHDRFRVAAGGRRFQVVEPILPMDVMGIYVFLPDLA